MKQKDGASNGTEVKSATRTLDILDLLVSNPDGLTATDVSGILDIPSASAHCLLQTICKKGYAHRDDESKVYTLGLSAFKFGEIAFLMLKRRLLALARSHLHEIVQKTHVSAHLAVLVNGSACYVDKIGAASRMDERTLVNVYIGRMVSPQLTAVGKALMCYLRPEVVKEIFESHPIPPNSPASWKTFEHLLAELEITRRREYAVDNEETALGVFCVAAPVFDVDGRVIAAIGVSGPVDKLGEARQRREAALVICREAVKLSRKLGHHKPKSRLSAA